MRQKKEVKGSYTVETALIMPMIMLILVLSVTLTLYYYDKCILTGLASEAAVAAAEEIRENNPTAGVVQNAEQATEKRLLFFRKGTVSVSEKNERVIVVIKTVKKTPPMQCMVTAAADITVPENYIRLYRTLNQDE